MQRLLETSRTIPLASQAISIAYIVSTSVRSEHTLTFWASNLAKNRPKTDTVKIFNQYAQSIGLDDEHRLSLQKGQDYVNLLRS